MSKWTTDKIKGKQEYALGTEMLGIVEVRVNGRRVEPEFLMKLKGVPRKDGEIKIEIQKATEVKIK